MGTLIAFTCGVMDDDLSLLYHNFIPNTKLFSSLSLWFRIRQQRILQLLLLFYGFITIFTVGIVPFTLTIVCHSKSRQDEDNTVAKMRSSYLYDRRLRKS